MDKQIFYRFGRILYKLRWLILVIWLALTAYCIPYMPTIISPFKTTGFTDKLSESAKATTFLEDHIGYNHNRIIVIYQSKERITPNSTAMARIKKSLSTLADYPLPHKILYPDTDKRQISKDKHTAYSVILIKTNEPLSTAMLEKLQADIKTPVGMTVSVGGEPVFVEGINKQTQRDLSKADLIAAPVALITLLIVFGSVVAALLPLILGGCCALIILMSLYLIGHVLTLSIFTLNIAMLLGLCLSLDYALFIISRFRAELASGKSVIDALATTQSTAGEAVFFSGLAVFISLSALLFFPVNILFSVGVGGLSAVFFAVISATIFLPAVLSLLKNKINLLPVRRLHLAGDSPFHFWRWLVTKVMHHAGFFFVLVFTVLLLFGYPILHVKFGLSDFKILPKHSESRDFFDIYNQKFDQNELAPIVLIAKTKNGHAILTSERIAELYRLTTRIKDDPAVKAVTSIVNTEPRLTSSQYQMLYTHDIKKADIKKLLEVTTAKDFTVINVISKYPVNSAENKALINRIHELKLTHQLSLQLTGTPVNNVQVLEKIRHIFPYALAWVLVCSFIILLVLFRSLILPLKAIVMSILSLCASYGVLVFIIQDGHFHQYLNFEPQGALDISLLIIIFCALFGFSMDYEVFLLTRIKECYEETHDTEKSIIFGIDKSSWIITSAALIVIFLCGSFLVADVLMVKAFGLGIAVAIFVDAFLIRTLLVPATMKLLGEWNWYLPKWLDKILPRF